MIMSENELMKWSFRNDTKWKKKWSYAQWFTLQEITPSNLHWTGDLIICFFVTTTTHRKKTRCNYCWKRTKTSLVELFVEDNFRINCAYLIKNRTKTVSENMSNSNACQLFRTMCSKLQTHEPVLFYTKGRFLKNCGKNTITTRLNSRLHIMFNL